MDFLHFVLPKDCLSDGHCRLSTILSLADIAGGCTTRRYSRGPTLTASLDFVTLNYFPIVSSIIHVQAEVTSAQGSCMEVSFCFIEENPFFGEHKTFGRASGLYVTTDRAVVKTLGEWNQDRKAYRKTEFSPRFSYNTLKKEYVVSSEHANTQLCCSGMQSLTWALVEFEDSKSVGKISFRLPIAIGSTIIGKYYANGSQLVNREGRVVVSVELDSPDASSETSLDASIDASLDILSETSPEDN